MCDIESITNIARQLRVDPGNLSYNGDKVLTRTRKGKSLHGFATIIQSLALESRDEKVKLWLQNPEIECLIAQWLDYAVLFVSPAVTDKSIVMALVKEMDTYLSARSYLVGQELTLADIVVFYAVHGIMTNLSPVNRELYLNLSRWFNHLQLHESIRQEKDLVNFSTTHLHGWATGTHL